MNTFHLSEDGRQQQQYIQSDYVEPFARDWQINCEKMLELQSIHLLWIRMDYNHYYYYAEKRPTHIMNSKNIVLVMR